MAEMVTVYRFRTWDRNTGEERFSRRWGTAVAIARVDGVIDRGSAITIDASSLDGNGMAEPDFDPQLTTLTRVRFRTRDQLIRGSSSALFPRS
jgi:hypothetical protein